MELEKTYMSLRSQLEELGTGESLVTDKSRAAAYLAAKEAGLVVTTAVLDDGQVEVVVTGQSVSKIGRLLAELHELSPGDRLGLLSMFETCCGMEIGNCSCEAHGASPDECLECGMLLVECICPKVEKKTKMSVNELKALIGQVENGTQPVRASEVLDDWRFSNDAPWYADDGCTYRKQLLWPLCKRSRTVEVDADDRDVILNVR